jgi:hypothetical protein
MDFLRQHNPEINWRTGTVIFKGDERCETTSSESESTEMVGSLKFEEEPIETSENFEYLENEENSTEVADIPLIASPMTDATGLAAKFAFFADSLAAFSVEDSLTSNHLPGIESLSSSSSPVPRDLAERFASVFAEPVKSLALPPHRDSDLAIDLVEGALPFAGKPYRLTVEEEEAQRLWLSEMECKGLIEKSASPWASPTFFVKQRDKLRPCMDYRKLNSVTVKDRNPIPLIDEMLNQLGRDDIKYYSALDLRGAYNLLRIRKGDEFKTAFVTKQGQFQFKVVPFGLCNAPAAFQRFMNDIFRNLIGTCVLVYIDDIIVFSQSRQEHQAHLERVLKTLQENSLYCKAEKCHFFQTSLKYLGYVVTKKGKSMDPSKVSAVQEWPVPKSKRDVQVFLGFANF